MYWLVLEVLCRMPRVLSERYFQGPGEILDSNIAEVLAIWEAFRGIFVESCHSISGE